MAATYTGNDQILEFGSVDGGAKQNYRYGMAAFQTLEQPQTIPAI